LPDQSAVRTLPIGGGSGEEPELDSPSRRAFIRAAGRGTPRRSCSGTYRALPEGGAGEDKKCVAVVHKLGMLGGVLMRGPCVHTELGAAQPASVHLNSLILARGSNALLPIALDGSVEELTVGANRFPVHSEDDCFVRHVESLIGAGLHTGSRGVG
jgi:hypothetical protein